MILASAVLILGLLSSGVSQAGDGLVADSGFAFPPISNCQTDLRYLNQVSGWQTTWPQQWQAIVTSDTGDIEQSIAYWSAVPLALNALKEQLRSGVSRKEFAPRPVVLRVHQQIQDVATVLGAADSPYLFTSNDSDSARRWNTLIRETVAPAFLDFEKFVRTEYLPEALSDSGLSALEAGEACFGEAAVWWTSMNLPTSEIEALGRRLLQENLDALALTGAAGESVAEILARLRVAASGDPTSAEELLEISQRALKRADEKTLAAFSKTAGEPVIVQPLPQYMQAAFPAGRYLESDAGNPARYVINPSRPNERRLMAEVIAFHEGIPGHHLFATYPRSTPAQTYDSGLWGLIEGWALYSEFVAEELGLYSSPLDVQGMIVKHLWAASRLVVEPGLHVYGWSREEAVQFMLENTVLSRTEIEIEVDRYLAMPGQSLCYMFGADLILSERELARAALGESFDLREFHDVVLEPGLRPLPVLRDDIHAWMENMLSQVSASR